MAVPDFDLVLTNTKTHVFFSLYIPLIKCPLAFQLVLFASIYNVGGYSSAAKKVELVSSLVSSCLRDSSVILYSD